MDSLSGSPTAAISTIPQCPLPAQHSGKRNLNINSSHSKQENVWKVEFSLPTPTSQAGHKHSC